MIDCFKIISIYKKLNERSFTFNSLFKFKNKSNKITINDLGFFIGPIINSGGRLSNSIIAVNLLISNDLPFIKNQSEKLIKLNNKRKEIEDKILSEINFELIDTAERNDEYTD